ncbi:SDR family oxidoreductase [Sphingomonas sp. BIUV-7]|uniref:SDR family oxidoreductase n=1 Tax=Sphingomonas natans TaxID=3063330 RepID=A0ABT8YCV9_9SPHN|nr:SDR family oxidoreductase [Sphingomonas sp. BIUV-7]MDO6416184.1 SDR family oxidoreductase [Sphingomonas sp. BIUV-7]
MKTVLVTGATRGLGLAITRRLVRDGYRVIASGRRMSPELSALSADLEGKISFAPLDLQDTQVIASFARDVLRSHGPIYGLVNNAAAGVNGILGTMHLSDIEHVMRVNAIAPIVLAKHLSRTMAMAGEGRIVNVSSIIARTGFAGLAAYGASKAAVEGLTRSLAREVGKRGVTVNAVAPGFMRTDMTASLEDDKLSTIQRRSALRDLASPEDAAAAVAYLLSADARAVTGTVMTIDAGSTA